MRSASAGNSSRHASQARRVCAVRSGLDRSNGRLVQPRQKVGIPPSRFCRSSSQTQPAWAASRVLSSMSPSCFSANSAPGVSSASGTPPGSGVHDQPPGAASVNGCTSRYCWASSHPRIGARSSAGNASPKALTERVVTHVARCVSIGQLPSVRTEDWMNSTPLRATG